jgi:Zn-dependent protease
MLNGMNQTGSVIVMFFGILVAVVFREAFHAKVAKYLGDKSEGTRLRATLSPLPHIDLLGTVLFPVLFLSLGGMPLGWGKPQMVDSRYFKKIKRDIFLVSFTGSVVNFGMAALCAVGLRLLGEGFFGNIMPGQSIDGSDQINPIPVFLNAVGLANVVIGTYNLIPVPYTDGWRALLNFVKYETAKKLNDSAMIINIVFLLLLVSGIASPVFGFGMGVFKLISGGL